MSSGEAPAMGQQFVRASLGAQEPGSRLAASCWDWPEHPKLELCTRHCAKECERCWVGVGTLKSDHLV